MKPVQIYTMDYCPYCTMAKQLLTAQNISFTEHHQKDCADEIETIMNQQNYSSFPMIFIGDEFIGGFSDMHALHQKGELIKKIQD